MCNNSGVFNLPQISNHSDSNSDENPWTKIIHEFRLQKEYERYCRYYEMDVNKDNSAGFIIWKQLGMEI